MLKSKLQNKGVMRTDVKTSGPPLKSGGKKAAIKRPAKKAGRKG